MFERSELVFPPECQLAHLGTSCGGDGFGWSGAPTLLLVTFLGEARKVTKKKATLRRRPSGSLDRGTERGRRQNLSRALASASLRTLAPDFPALRAAIEAASKGEKCKSPMRLVCAKTLLVGAADQPRLRDSGDARWQIITASPETSPSSLASSSAVLPCPSSSSFSASARTG